MQSQSKEKSLSKRPWAKPQIEVLPVSEAVLRLMRSEQPTGTILREIDALGASYPPSASLDRP